MSENKKVLCNWQVYQDEDGTIHTKHYRDPEWEGYGYGPGARGYRRPFGRGLGMGYGGRMGRGAGYGRGSGRGMGRGFGWRPGLGRTRARWMIDRFEDMYDEFYGADDVPPEDVPPDADV